MTQKEAGVLDDCHHSERSIMELIFLKIYVNMSVMDDLGGQLE